MPAGLPIAEPTKFRDPARTAKGEARAVVDLVGLDTLWLNTGTLCNIECTHCYIESSPTNDRLVYLTLDDALPYFEEIRDRHLGTREIGLTGGEPFLNPHILEITQAALDRGFEVLILTNAMQPLLRRRIQRGLSELREREHLTLRVSLDHYTPERHDQERGHGSFSMTLRGMRWLRDAGFRMHVAGRTCWDEAEGTARRGYARLFERESFRIDATDPRELVLFPEMRPGVDVPEITTACWGILKKDPTQVMCSSSRMVVKRKGHNRPSVVACTLLPYDEAFELGHNLEAASQTVPLNHPYCAQFCVLGGGSCSG